MTNCHVDNGRLNSHLGASNEHTVCLNSLGTGNGESERERERHRGSRGGSNSHENERRRPKLKSHQTRLLDSKYQLGEELGRGSSGKVYRALNRDSGHFVAIKQIPLHGMSSTHLQAVQSEISMLHNLQHPQIVRFFETIRTAEHLYLVLEYVENGSLAAILKHFGRFPEHILVDYMRQVLQGLEWLHSHGVCHRDIKGANLLITKDGQVKLADFGVAGKLTDPVQPNSVVGTPYWMAPEIIQMSGFTTASDIWSLGCTIIELISGAPPYFELRPVSALYRIVHDESSPPLPSGLSKPLTDFLTLCFTRDPEQRATAAQLRQHSWVIQEVQDAGSSARTALSALPGSAHDPRISRLVVQTVETSRVHADSLGGGGTDSDGTHSVGQHGSGGQLSNTHSAQRSNTHSAQRGALVQSTPHLGDRSVGWLAVSSHERRKSDTSGARHHRAGGRSAGGSSPSHTGGNSAGHEQQTEGQAPSAGHLPRGDSVPVPLSDGNGTKRLSPRADKLFTIESCSPPSSSGRQAGALLAQQAALLQDTTSARESTARDVSRDVPLGDRFNRRSEPEDASDTATSRSHTIQSAVSSQRSAARCFDGTTALQPQPETAQSVTPMPEPSPLVVSCLPPPSLSPLMPRSRQQQCDGVWHGREGESECAHVEEGRSPKGDGSSGESRGGQSEISWARLAADSLNSTLNSASQTGCSPPAQRGQGVGLPRTAGAAIGGGSAGRMAAAVPREPPVLECVSSGSTRRRDTESLPTLPAPTQLGGISAASCTACAACVPLAPPTLAAPALDAHQPPIHQHHSQQHPPADEKQQTSALSPRAPLTYVDAPGEPISVFGSSSSCVPGRPIQLDEKQTTSNQPNANRCQQLREAARLRSQSLSQQLSQPGLSPSALARGKGEAGETARGSGEIELEDALTEPGRLSSPTRFRGARWLESELGRLGERGDDGPQPPRANLTAELVVDAHARRPMQPASASEACGCETGGPLGSQRLLLQNERPLSGYLWKRCSTWFSLSYHRRLFILQGEHLCYVSSAHSAAIDGSCTAADAAIVAAASAAGRASASVAKTDAASSLPSSPSAGLRRIHLGSITSVRVHSKLKFEFELICSWRTFRLRAPSAEALAIWVTTISAEWMQLQHRRSRQLVEVPSPLSLACNSASDELVT
mmetsp:Transcript_57328/g.94801  ORF Transcript_57328/g.94801 Transcript_57328/m.94801 type:complete len:1163 (+) Transcript_57328:97-3585(+)